MIEKNTVLLDLERYEQLKKIEKKYYDLKESVIYYDKNGREMTSMQLAITQEVPTTVGISREKIEDLFDYKVPIDKVHFLG